MENLRLGKAWRGDFINVQGTWAGRAGALENPAGDDVLNFPPGMAVGIVETPNQTWPLDPVRDQGWRARGYRRDEQRNPVFRIQGSEGVSVEEFIDPVIRESGVHLQRRFKFSGETMPLGLMLRLAISDQMEELGPRKWRTEEGVTLIVEGAAAEIYEVLLGGRCLVRAQQATAWQQHTINAKEHVELLRCCGHERRVAVL